jgi:integral membrane sensor domain MASE1/anti-sigma regulatory factor (Ser/Thr protein kinase)
VQLLVVVACYYGSAELGLRLAVVGKSVTPLWPPTGVALVAMLVLGRRIWPAIAVAAFAVNLPISPNALTAVVIATGNTLAPLVATTLLGRIGFDRSLARVKDAFVLVFVAALASMCISATVGSLALWLTDAVSGSKLAGSWSVWWTGDAMGVLVVAPVLLLITAERDRAWPERSRLELVAVSALVVAACAVALLGEQQTMFSILPVLGWIAWRFEQRGAAPATLFVSVAATLAAVWELGPFTDASVVHRMVVLQSFNATVAFSSILLASAVSQRENFVEHEHDIAESLQRSLLSERSAECPEVASAARYIPARAEVAVGGDWYDVIPLHDGRLGFVVGDVAGHGVGAAAEMGQLRMVLRAYALEDHSPAETLQRVNGLLRDLHSNAMATAWYGCYDPASQVLTFSSAGHFPALVVDADGHNEFLDEIHGPPLGAIATTQYTESTQALDGAATLLLYTDGLVEKRGEPIDARLDALRAAVSTAPRGLDAMCDHIVATLLDGAIEDDVALLALRPIAVGGPTLRLREPALPTTLPAARRVVRAWLTQNGCSSDETFDILVALSEAYSNAVQHAYGVTPGLVEVDGTIGDGVIDITVSDHGTWRSRPAVRRDGAGKGIRVMRSLMDDVAIESNGPGTTVRMRRVCKVPSTSA